MVDYLGGPGGNGASGQRGYEYQVPSAQAAKGKDGAKPGTNLWNSILQGVAKRDDQQDSYLLMLGNTGVGKKSLLREIDKKLVLSRNKKVAVDAMGSDFAALDFSFLYVKDLMDAETAQAVVTTDDNLPKLNVWQV